MAMKPTILITGCSDGSIGHSLALEFVRQNYHVFAGSRRLCTMKSLEKNPDITLIELDVTSPSSIQAAYETVFAATVGTLDILYQNAGVRTIALAMHCDYELALKIFSTNILGTVEITRVFMPLLMKAGPGSRIAFSSSLAGYMPIPTQSLYNASKAALHSYISTLELELKPFGIFVIDVASGTVGTAMLTQNQMEKLPEDSPYKSIESDLNEAWVKIGGGIPVEAYTKHVVGKVLQKNPPQRFFAGAGATLGWAIDKLNADWVYKAFFWKIFALGKLSRAQD
ncbi:uncharacterized protein EAE97_003890 [Botrytis byssoidea]|uniref:NADPH-dependent 1-acyldihydroxyacetone phosphate reductase n=1 Tax=Botrytis byssoidea TaxID=139641 RepID=A0A9P5LWP3_9HELO|nr:uncharacterized protein EAE97_003890 [Botrytis byssoidea]KAF7948479.1 hypothetical protein EAE97_003890 [Botrytis byssoidea]